MVLKDLNPESATLYNHTIFVDMLKNAFSVGLKKNEVRNGLRGRIEAVTRNVHMELFY